MTHHVPKKGKFQNVLRVNKSKFRPRTMAVHTLWGVVRRMLRTLDLRLQEQVSSTALPSIGKISTAGLLIRRYFECNVRTGQENGILKTLDEINRFEHSSSVGRWHLTCP
jgi:hypothetical protein